MFGDELHRALSEDLRPKSEGSKQTICWGERVPGRMVRGKGPEPPATREELGRGGSEGGRQRWRGGRETGRRGFIGPYIELRFWRYLRRETLSFDLNFKRITLAILRTISCRRKRAETVATSGAAAMGHAGRSGRDSVRMGFEGRMTGFADRLDGSWDIMRS